MCYIWRFVSIIVLTQCNLSFSGSGKVNSEFVNLMYSEKQLAAQTCHNQIKQSFSFDARLKIQSQSQIFRYGRSIFCLPHRPNFSDIFDLSLHWVSVVRGFDATQLIFMAFSENLNFNVIHFLWPRSGDLQFSQENFKLHKTTLFEPWRVRTIIETVYFSILLWTFLV